MKLNLGCENDFWGDVRVDCIQTDAANYVIDLNRGLPELQDNSFSEIRAFSILEHIHNLIFLMDEIFRVAKEGASLHIVVPYWTWNGAVADPQHCRYFNEESWFHYSVDWPRLVLRSGITHGYFKSYNLRMNALPGQDIEDRLHRMNIVHDMYVNAIVGKDMSILQKGLQ